MDTDNDGIPEFLVAHAFENEAARSVGIVSLITHGADLRQPWTVREIDRLTTSHRLRTANGLFINAPLTGASAVAPEYKDHTPLVAYRPGDWHRQLITAADEGVVHGVEDAGGARLEFAGQRLLGGRAQGAGGFARRAGIGGEAETLKASDMLAFDQDVTGGVYFGFEHCILS